VASSKAALLASIHSVIIN